MTTIRPYVPHPDGFAFYVELNLLKPSQIISREGLVNRKVFYAAVWDNLLDSWHAVIMPVTFKTQGGVRELTYSILSENDNPFEADCPEHVLDHLDLHAPVAVLSQTKKERLDAVYGHLDAGRLIATHRRLLEAELLRVDPHLHARPWRKRCREGVLAEQRAATLEEGDLVTLNTATRVDSEYVQHFHMHRRTPRTALLPHHGNVQCAHNGWKRHVEDIVPAGSATDEQKRAARLKL